MPTIFPAPTVSPAQDTRPIELAKLNAEERRILCDINSLVRGIAKSAPPVLPPKHDEPKVDVPWGRMADKDRTGQVLLIEGGRGVGKTSLLLTLLDGWQRSWKRMEPGSVKMNEDNSNEKPSGFIAEDGREIGQFVRHLPILDFDPIPPDMPLHAWLVHAWGDLVKWASDCPDGRTQPSPKGVRTRSLTERWQKVFRASALAFSKSPPSEHGVVGHVLNRKEQIEDWQKLHDEWRAMVDDLLSALVNNRGLGRDTVIVVPIDDVDLQVERIAELLPALRLLYHPRVVYLLTADLGHMGDMLALSFQGRERKLSECDNGTRVQSSQLWSKTLARAAIEKSFPIAHRFAQSLLTPSDVVHQLEMHGQFGDLLNYKNDVMTVAQWITKWDASVGSGQGLVTFRRLQQVLDARSTDSDTDRNEPPREISGASLRAFAQLLDPEDKGMAILTEGTIEGRWRGRLNVTFEISRYIEMIVQQQWICIGYRPHFAFYPLENSDDTDPDARAREAVAISMALGLEPEFDQKIVFLRNINWVIEEAFAWTRWEGPKSALFFWPFAWYPTSAQLLEWAREWRDITTKGMLDLRNPVGFLAYHWIRNQVVWAVKGMEDLPEKITAICGDAPATIEEPNWNVLLERIYTTSFPTATGENEQHDNLVYWTLSKWRRDALPLMAAPEFGLPDTIAKTILAQFDTFISTNKAPRQEVWPSYIENLRKEHMSNALYRHLSFESRASTKSRTSTLPEEVEKDASLLRDVIDQDQTKPWHQFMKKLEPKRGDKSVKPAKAKPAKAKPAKAKPAKANPPKTSTERNTRKSSSTKKL